ncbi:MAG: excisionase family DNA-binding protein [Pseudonocardia sp.]
MSLGDVDPRRHPSDQDQDGGDAALRYLTVRQTADRMNTSERFVRRLVAERRIAFHKVGAHVRISVGDIGAFLQAGRVEPITTASVSRDLSGGAA